MKLLLSLLSPAGRRARLSILIFHRVLAQPDPLFPGEIDSPRFEAICRWLAPRFQVLPLDQALMRLQQGTLPARALAITFDDGYADNHDIAMPLLLQHGLCATFFIATGFLDGGRMWNDTVIEAVRRTPHQQLDVQAANLAGLAFLPTADVAQRSHAIAALIKATKYLPVAQRQVSVAAIAQAAGCALPDDLMMRSVQVQALHGAGMQIGAHTISHPILATLDRDSALQEMQGGKQALEALLQKPVTVFAYPNGRPGEDYKAQTVALARESGFQAAVSTAWGVSRQGDDIFQIPRFTPWDRSFPRWGQRLTKNLLQTRFATV